MRHCAGASCPAGRWWCLVPVKSARRTADSVLDVEGPVFVQNFGESGPSLVLVHGLASSHVHWLAVAPRLAAGHRVYVPDLPGFGRTPVAGRPTDLAGYRRVLGRLLARLDEPAVVVGNSMGALLGILAAVDHPDLVRALVLVSPPAPRAPLTPLEPKLAVLLSAYAWPGVGEVTRGLWVRVQGPEGLVRSVLESCLAAPERVPPEVLRAALAVEAERAAHDDEVHAFLSAYRSTWRFLLNGRRFDHLVRAVAAPALILHGTRDKLVPTSVVSRFRTLRPDWELRELPGLGHMPQVEDPRGFVILVKRWLAARKA
jgi:pimeloyl-ACP methyl ester carboxylesterase